LVLVELVSIKHLLKNLYFFLIKERLVEDVNGNITTPKDNEVIKWCKLLIIDGDFLSNQEDSISKNNEFIP